MNCTYTHNAVVMVLKYGLQKEERFPGQGLGSVGGLLAACEKNALREGYTIITYDNVLAQAKDFGYEEEAQ